MNAILMRLVDACIDTHCKSNTIKDAKRNFKALILQAFTLGEENAKTGKIKSQGRSKDHLQNQSETNSESSIQESLQESDQEGCQEGSQEIAVQKKGKGSKGKEKSAAEKAADALASL